MSNDAIDDLQLELIISNVNVATYEIVDYLDKRLWPIGQPEYTVSNSKESARKLIPFDHKLKSFNLNMTIHNYTSKRYH